MKKIILVVWTAFALLLLSLTVTPSYAQTKKPWSKKAKGAAIGAGTGAAAGAILSHKKGKGAIIGGAVGAGAGYLYGKHRAKKTGTN